MGGRAAARATMIISFGGLKNDKRTAGPKGTHAAAELFFPLCPAENKRQLINRAVSNLAVTSFWVGGSICSSAPSSLSSRVKLLAGWSAERFGQTEGHAGLGN